MQFNWLTERLVHLLIGWWIDWLIVYWASSLIESRLIDRMKKALGYHWVGFLSLQKNKGTSVEKKAAMHKLRKREELDNKVFQFG